MTGVILSGGENRRMPYRKGLLLVEGRTIIERGLDTLRRVFSEVVISTNEPEHYFRFGAPLIGDILNGRGPLTGIVSVLSATGADAVFVMACDMPFPSEGLIRHLAAEFRDSGKAFDAVVPRWNGNAEPLFGVYGSSALRALKDAASSGNRGLQEALGRMRVCYVPEETVGVLDPGGRSFMNVNTLEDYTKIGGVLCSD